MKLCKRLAVAVATALCLSSATAGPVLLTIDGAWFDFSVGDVGDVWRSPLDGYPITFTLTSGSAFTLRLVDIGFSGDRVEVLSGGTTLLGTTASVPIDDTVFAFTPDEAFAAPGTWSQGSWSLGAGSYSFTGTATASPFGGGAWAISAVAGGTHVVPEPGSLALVLGALALAAATTRRRLGQTDQR